MNKTSATNDKKIPRRATYQDVLNAPPYKVAEIVDGKLCIHARPEPLHAVAG